MMIIMLLFSLFLLIGFTESREHKISLNEETPINTIIFDLNTLSSSFITYQLLESSSLLLFNSSTNSISIIKRIDRDTLCPNDNDCSNCYLTIKLYDMFYYDILLLKFQINDINDNPPIFSSNTYSISLTENNMPGMKIRLSKAEDIDCLANGVQLYELTYVSNNRIIISSINLFQRENQTKNSDQSFYLFYDLKSSDLYLVINISLDRELQNEYIFTITANDHKHTATSKLTLTVLDVNDHNPRFSQSIYNVNISHTTPIGTILLKLIAYDADSDENARIFYSLLSIDGSKLGLNDFFQLNSYTGELSLISKLSFETKNIFKLIIAASDGTNNAIPALATVYINIQNDLLNNDQSIIQITFGSNRISKNLSEVYLAENLPNATFIAYVKSDQALQVFPEEINRGFFIQKLTENSFTILTDRSYDREQRSSYDVQLRHGDIQRSFTIIVTDINDCKPIWNSSLLNIDLDQYIHLNEPIILTLNATDYDENPHTGYRKKSTSWPQWITLVSDRLIINCTLQSNETNNDCWFYLSNGEVWLDIEAYDIDEPKFSSGIKIRLYRSTVLGNDLAFLQINRTNQQDAFFVWFKHEYIIISIASLMGILFVIVTILSCIYCRRESKHNKSSSLMTNVTDDNSTKQKIIQTSSSEQSSSAGSLYDSEKSDNITVETSDMFLFSPKRIPPHASDNLTNKLFHSIQTDLSLLTETNQQIISTRGTYV